MKNELVYGIFDWDDNILRMPTLIKAFDSKKKINIWMTTDQFAQIRNTTHHYLFDERSFHLFYDFDPNSFSIDISRALLLRTYGPSFEKFIAMIINGNVIAIVTARGHKPNTIKNGVIQIVKALLNEEEIKEWHDNLNEYRKLFNQEPLDNTDQLEEEYWNKCYFIGVGGDPDKMYQSIRSVEDQKSLEIRNIVNNINNWTVDLQHKYQISIGFSDDDTANLSKVHTLFKEISNIYPNFKFTLFDTSNQGLKKIVI